MYDIMLKFDSQYFEKPIYIYIYIYGYKFKQQAYERS